MNPPHDDVLIIGGGAIGLATALALLEAGRSVRILDAGVHPRGMGENDLAFRYFEEAVHERALPGYILRDPVLDGMRSDPRFQGLLQRMGLSP